MFLRFVSPQQIKKQHFRQSFHYSRLTETTLKPNPERRPRRCLVTRYPKWRSTLCVGKRINQASTEGQSGSQQADSFRLSSWCSSVETVACFGFTWMSRGRFRGWIKGDRISWGKIPQGIPHLQVAELRHLYPNLPGTSNPRCQSLWQV